LRSDVDVTAAYYKSSPQVRALLKRAGHLISVAAARPGHKSPQPVSALAAASGSDEPRHLRDRLGLNDIEFIRTAANAGVPRKTLAVQYAVSTRSIYRILTGKR